MTAVVYTEVARDDLLDIWFYLAEGVLPRFHGRL